jgi:hypothetical protein
MVESLERNMILINIITLLIAKNIINIRHQYRVFINTDKDVLI